VEAKDGLTEVRYFLGISSAFLCGQQ